MPRLSLILSSASAQAMLVRQGPKKWSCVWGWDRSSDAFVPGQCVKGYLEATNAHLSPCGQWFAYSVYRTDIDMFEYYCGVSRPPWLKALAYWKRASGGVFREIDGETHLEIPGDAQSNKPHQTHPGWESTGIHLKPRSEPWGHPIANGGKEFEVWLAGGWVPTSPWEICPEEECKGVASWWKSESVHRIHFEKHIPKSSWKIRLSHWCGCHDDDKKIENQDSHRGVSFETFTLISHPGKVLSFPDWSSADYDAFRHRMVWTKAQQLWAMDVLRDGALGEPKLLLDLTGKAGWKCPAPY